MLWIELLFIIGALVAVAAVAAGYGAMMAPARRDAGPIGLPDGDSLQGADVRRLRFNVVLRGYRMREVDEVLERFAAELERREAQLADLLVGTGSVGRVQPGEPGPAPDPVQPPDPEQPVPPGPDSPQPDTHNPDTPDLPGRPGHLPDVGQPYPRHV